MPGQGKYTVYAPPANDKNVRLSRLFKGSTDVTNPFEELVGKENDAREQTIARAKAFLTPDKQSGDMGQFPNGVNMNYEGDSNGVTVPDTSEGGDVKWREAGDPANPFTPDLRSPGPGQTDAASADNLQTDPEISVTDIKGEGYVPGAPKTSTKSPAQASEVVSSVELGKPLPLGSPVANG